MYCTLVSEVKRGQMELTSKQINNTKRCSNIYEVLGSAVDIGLSHFLFFYTTCFITCCLSHNGILEAGDSADTTTLSNKTSTASLSKLLNNTRIKSDLKTISGSETRLESLPDLLLGVENTLGATLPALEPNTVAGLGTLGRSDELNWALVVVDLTLLDLGRGGEDHGAGLDAAHLDGLEVADHDDLAALHGLEGDEAVETRADGAADLTLVLDVVLVAGLVANSDGGNVEGVGVGVVDGLENVTDSEVNESRGERSSRGGSSLLLGSLLLLLLLRLISSNLLLGRLNNLLDLLLGAINKRSLTTSGSSSSSLLLLLLLLSLGVNGRLHVKDVITINLDLVLILDIEAEQGRVLDKVDVADDVGVSLLAGSLLGRPLGDDGSEGLVDGDVGLGGLAAEEGGAAGEVVVEGLEDGGLVLGGLEALGGGEPLLDLSLLGGSVGLGGEGCHSEGYQR